MKRLIISLFALFAFVSIGFSQLTFKGTLAAEYQVENLYLYKYIGPKAYPFDTIKVEKNSFSKTYKTFDKGLYLLGIGETREEIVLAESELKISVPFPFVEMPWKTQSKANADYFKIRTNNKEYDQKINSLDAEFRKFEHLAELDNVGFQNKLNALRLKLDTANKNFDAFYNGFITKASSPYGKLIAEFMAVTPQTNKNNYFIINQLNDSQLTSGDFVLRKVNYYFMRFGALNNENLYTETETLLARTPDKNSGRELMYESLVNNALQINEGLARNLQKKHSAEFGTTKISERLAMIVPAPAPEIGQKVPEIEAVDKDGRDFRLSDLRGKVVLIDFWASWCGPCRRESPNVVENYNTYKDKGFTIVSISADKDRNAWIQAIAQDNYTWKNHLLSAENGYKAQRDFQVQGYPTMFLIDRDGTLIAFGNSLRGPGLTSTLSSVFGN
jgi:peroxiredoxin